MSARCGVLHSWAQIGESFLAVHRLHTAAFEVVIASVEILAELGELLQISSHRVLDEIVGSAPSFGGQFLKAGFGFRA